MTITQPGGKSSTMWARVRNTHTHTHIFVTVAYFFVFSLNVRLFHHLQSTPPGRGLSVPWPSQCPWSLCLPSPPSSLWCAVRNSKVKAPMDLQKSHRQNVQPWQTNVRADTLLHLVYQRTSTASWMRRAASPPIRAQHWTRTGPGPGPKSSSATPAETARNTPASSRALPTSCRTSVAVRWEAEPRKKRNSTIVAFSLFFFYLISLAARVMRHLYVCSGCAGPLGASGDVQGRTNVMAQQAAGRSQLHHHRLLQRPAVSAVRLELQYLLFAARWCWSTEVLLMRR